MGLADFEAMVRRAGLVLTAEQVAALHGQWPHVAAMLERVRAAGRDRDAEPAMVFVPTGEVVAR